MDTETIGMATLHQRGLDLAGLDGGSMAELLEWHDVRTRMPDSDITVLAWTRDQCGGQDWVSAWWSGEQWMDCASGDRVYGDVTHWAQPEGPPATRG
jgi:hypothetical protein